VMAGEDLGPLKYRWLLFDADGTLFDYDRAEATALERTFGQMGLVFDPSYARTYRQINEHIWRQFEQHKISQQRLRPRRFELLFESAGIGSDSEAFSVRYLRNLAEASQLIDGAKEIVASLCGNVSLIIVTNGLKDVQRSRLARSVIGKCFADIVISEEVGVAKPDPAIFEVAFERMGKPPKEDVLMVGDSLASDIRGGNNYGIDTCWFNPRGQTPDPGVAIQYEIRDLRELLSVVGIPEGWGD
jgi:2-haloacid dehalogenase